MGFGNVGSVRFGVVRDMILSDEGAVDLERVLNAENLWHAKEIYAVWRSFSRYWGQRKTEAVRQRRPSSYRHQSSTEDSAGRVRVRKSPQKQSLIVRVLPYCRAW